MIEMMEIANHRRAKRTWKTSRHFPRA